MHEDGEGREGSKGRGGQGLQAHPALGAWSVGEGGGAFRGGGAILCVEILAAVGTARLRHGTAAGAVLLGAAGAAVGASVASKDDDRVPFSGSAAFPTTLTHTRDL